MYDKLLSMLYALKFACADVHYYVKGDGFWGDHKLADDIREDLDEWIDSVNEVCFLGANKDAPYSKDVVSAAMSLIPAKIDDSRQMFVNLRRLIFDVLSYIEEIIPEASAGEANLIGGIAEQLQKRYGLIGRRVK